ncbi:MAG: hypothetical protein NVS2B12_36180 [Ktedonobacteraceae bacterium]
MSDNTNFIGKYRLVEELASGAFGRVYRGEDTSMNNRIVAIKLLHSTYLSSSQEHHSFLQEAQFLKLLKHPFILPVLDVGIDKDFPYMVTEFAPNGSLLDRLTKQAPRLLPIQEALLILAQIGQALQYAHQQNVIHRDLKPANILFNANGDAMLADFGIATMLATSIKYGTAIGTPYYMAPEQFRGSISKEGDQYALGCIAYELFTGRVPFTAPDFFALGYKHMSETPLAPTQLNLLLSRSIDQAVLKAMAKQRSDRYADISAFLAALGAPSAITPPAGIHQDTRIAYGQREQEGSRRGAGEAQEGRGRPQGSPPPIHPAHAPTSVPGNVKEGVEDDEDVTIMKNFKPGRQALLDSGDAIREGSFAALMMTAVDRQIDREETGKQPLVAYPRTIDREEVGKVFSPADSLPRVLEGPLPASTPTLTPHNMAMRPARSVIDDVIATDQRSPSAHNAGITHPPSAHNAGQILPPSAYNVGIINPPSAHNTGHPVGADLSRPSPIYRLPWEDPAGGTASSYTQTDTDRPSLFPARRKRGSRQSKWPVAAAIALVLLLLGSGGLYAMSTLFRNTTTAHTRNQAPAVATIPTATVSITPTHTNLNGTYKISAVTGKPNASQQQVGAHILSSTLSQSSTVQATGQRTIPATLATGRMDVFNDSTSPITYPVETYTGTDGVSVTTYQGFTVPAGNPTTNPITWGYVSVPTYSDVLGSSGNIKAGDINVWISVGSQVWVFVGDYNGFSGGQDAQNYRYVQGSDYNNAVNTANQLQTLETSRAQAAVNGQVPANEVMQGSVQCTPYVSYNHRVGDHATSITSNISVTCIAEIYDQQAALAMASDLLTRKIDNTPNASYTLANKITTKVLQANVVDGKGTIALLISAEGVGVFQFSDAQKLELTSLIAGKSEQDAQTILSNQPGISAATINISGGNGHTLPTDAGRITISVI